MKNIGLLSGRSNKTFRVILVRVKYIEKYWNVNRVRKHSAIPSYCMNPMKIICWYIIFHTYQLSENYFFLSNANLYLLLRKNIFRVAEFEICRPRKSFCLLSILQYSFLPQTAT